MPTALDLQPEIPTESGEITRQQPPADTRILTVLFRMLLVQLLALVAMSFVFQHGPMFVQRFYFGLDFHDFYVGALDFLTHNNFYVHGRIYTPPSSVLVGLPFAFLPFRPAAQVFFVLNLTLVFYALRSFARRVGLSPANQLVLLGIAALFYPVYFLVERGNLDGIMMALLVFGLGAKSPILRALGLGVSVATKLYSGLLGIVLLRKRQWKLAVLSGLFAIVLQLPFLPLVRSFVLAVTGRSSLLRVDENISPAGLSFLVVGPLGGLMWKYIFVLLWGATLIWKLIRDKDSDFATNWPVYVPWMITYPIVVYPYTGVLAVALLALIAAHCQRRPITNAEALVIVGIGMLGFQATAWSGYSHTLLPHLIPPIGTMAMIVGACGLPTYDSPTTLEC